MTSLKESAVAIGGKMKGLYDRWDSSVGKWKLPILMLGVILAVRLMAAYTWYWGVETKPPGKDWGWLRGWFERLETTSPLPGYGAIMGFILDHEWLFQLVGWTGFFVEAYLALMLVLGFATRFHGLMAGFWGLQIALTSWGVPHREYLWVVLPLALVGFMAGEFRSGRVLGLDARLRPRWLNSESAFLRFVAEHGM